MTTRRLDPPNSNASTNWAGNVQFRPAHVLRPKTIAELSAAVRKNDKIRVVGSRHSFNEIAATDATWLELSELAVPFTIHSEREVEVPAAMTLREVNQRLAYRGLALASLGDIDQQQIGGLIATGTHGSGLEWGTLSDLVTAVKLVNGKGELVEVKDGPELAAARTHLGALGAIVSVTFQTCLAHNLKRERKIMPIEKALTPEFMRAHDHAQLFYFPFTEDLYVRTLNRTNDPASSWFTLGAMRGLESVMENQGIRLFFLVFGAKWFPGCTRLLMRCVHALLRKGTDVGPSSLQMTSVRTMKYHELEMALDLADLPAAFDAVRTIIQELSKLEPASERYYAHLPVTIRAVRGRPDNFLSPTLGRDTAYISITSRTGFEGYERYFAAVETRLIDQFGARPHWGKHHSSNPVALYPTAEAFKAVCRAFDPEGKFRNEFVTSRLFSDLHPEPADSQLADVPLAG